jgi:all-trans-8'-apo-beta-carotenal 15,15'-oxygenase
MRSTRTTRKNSGPPWAGIFDDVQEHAVEAHVEGKVPEALLGGTVFRNGAVASTGWTHLFDGDGMMRAFRFNGDQTLRYSSRFVDTERRKKARQGREPRRFGFGTCERSLLPSNPIKLLADSNTSNTNVIRVGNELLSLIESGAPYALDPDTLETLGERTYRGQLGPTSPLSAHPRRCPRTGDFYNFGMQYGPSNSIRTYRLTAERGLECLHEISIPFASINHDFVLTERYMVFCLGSPRIPARRALKIPLGLSSIEQTIAWEGMPPALIILAPRDGSAPIRFETEAFTQFHFAGGHEVGDELLVDLYRTFDPVWFSQELRVFRESLFSKPLSTAHRLRIDVKRRSARLEEMSDVAAEFPQVDPRRATGGYRYAYATTSPPGFEGLPTAIGKLDGEHGSWEHHCFGEGHVVTEPMVAPKSTEGPDDEVWLMTTEYDPATRTSTFVVLDGADLGAGPVCRAQLGVNAGYTFHGFFEGRVDG